MQHMEGQIKVRQEMAANSAHTNSIFKPHPEDYKENDGPGSK